MRGIDANTRKGGLWTMMCMYMCVYMSVCARMHVHVCMCVCVSECVCECVYVCMYVSLTRIHTHARNVCVCVYMSVVGRLLCSVKCKCKPNHRIASCPGFPSVEPHKTKAKGKSGNQANHIIKWPGWFHDCLRAPVSALRGIRLITEVTSRWDIALIGLL